MNALASSEPVLTPPAAPRPASPAKTKIDRYGRNPDSAGEVLRRQTNYEADSGYAPLYAAWLADLPRLSSGQVCTLFIMTVGVLSLGRPDNPKRGRRHEWTKPVTVEYLAEVCRCHVRDIQRQIKDLAERKVIAVETTARGTYRASLLFRDWQSLPDYQPARLVVIDEVEEDAVEEDSAGVAISKEAVRLVKRPLTVRAGKTARAIKINVGVKSIRWQNAATLPLVFDGVVQAGELVISTRLVSDWRNEVSAEGEREANSQRHPCRDGEGAAALDPLACHKRAAEIIEIFDPLLQKSGGRLLVGDAAAVLSAAKALGSMPAPFLVHWLTEVGKNPRASRPISGPRVVASIVREAFGVWLRSGERSGKAGASGTAGAGEGGRRNVKKGGASSFADSVRREAERRLQKRGRL